MTKGKCKICSILVQYQAINHARYYGISDADGRFEIELGEEYLKKNNYQVKYSSNNRSAHKSNLNIGFRLDFEIR
jgi:hypothetical protein